MRIRLLALVVFLVVGVVAGTANATGYFTDDDSSIHLRAIEAIADEGITKGCNPPLNDLFCPTASVTREQMATFLVRALDLPAGTATFMDTGSSVHAADISALAEAGITKGCNPPDNTLFCPKDRVTREQMATFLVRALNLPGGTVTFTDTTTSIHAANISALAEAGITKGCNPPDNTMFCPTDPVTREQMATFLARALDLDTKPRLVVSTIESVIDVEFGTSETDTVAELTALLGSPTSDLPAKCPYFLPGADNMRYVRWGSLIVAIKTIDSGNGDLGLVGWRYKLDGAGQPEAGGPLAEHVEMPFGLELGDPIQDAVDAGGGAIFVPSNYGWMVSEFDYFTVEATGLMVNPAASIDGVQQGFGFDCG